MSVDHPSNREAPITPWLYARTFTVVVLVLGTLILGITYLALQWQRTGKIKHGLFVGLLLGATLILLQGMRSIYKYVTTNIVSFFAFAQEKKSFDEIRKQADAYCNKIFNTRDMSISGVLYGLIIGSAIFVMNIWKTEGLLKIFLFCFLFSVNFVTGIGFYGLLKFFVSSWELGKLVKTDLWQRENPTMWFFRKVKKSTSLIAIVYITICVTSIYLSQDFRAEYLTSVYSIFAGLIVILVFILPEIPIRKKIIIAKQKALTTINDQVQGEFRNAFEEAKSENKEIDLSKIERLIVLREKIEKISVWPFGLDTFTTAFSVVLITILPIILEFILNRVF
jgi:hypothetical protein